MDLSAYGQDVVAGSKSILSAARGWRTNPLTSRVNRRLWSPLWPAVLLLLVAAAIAVDQLLPPFSRLIGLVPPLTVLTFLPNIVRDLVYSAPALFAFVIVWRIHRLRSSKPVDWSDRAAIRDFGGQFFDAAALPVAVATLALGIGIQLTTVVLGSLPADPETGVAGATAIEVWTVAGGSSRLARTIVIVALVTGVLGVHRRIGTGLGKLFGAGFVVWSIHLGIGFAVPWMTSWWTYLPVIGKFAPDRSANWAHLLFDLAVACAAWIAAREKWREAPLWSDAPPRPSPSPPPPPPPTD